MRRMRYNLLKFPIGILRKATQDGWSRYYALEKTFLTQLPLHLTRPDIKFRSEPLGGLALDPALPWSCPFSSLPCWPAVPLHQTRVDLSTVIYWTLYVIMLQHRGNPSPLNTTPQPIVYNKQALTCTHVCIYMCWKDLDTHSNPESLWKGTIEVEGTPAFLIYPPPPPPPLHPPSLASIKIQCRAQLCLREWLNHACHGETQWMIMNFASVCVWGRRGGGALAESHPQSFPPSTI